MSAQPIRITTEDGKPWAECHGFEFNDSPSRGVAYGINQPSEPVRQSVSLRRLVAGPGFENASRKLGGGKPETLIVHQGGRAYRLVNVALTRVKSVMESDAPELYHEATMHFDDFAVGAMVHDNESGEHTFMAGFV